MTNPPHNDVRRRISIMPNSPTAIANCRSPLQPETRWNKPFNDVLGRGSRGGLGAKLFNSEKKQRRSDPSGMSETAYYVAGRSEKVASASQRSFPVDRFRVAGLRNIHCRGAGNRRAGWSRRSGLRQPRFLQMLLNGGKLDGKRLPSSRDGGMMKVRIRSRRRQG